MGSLWFVQLPSQVKIRMQKWETLQCNFPPPLFPGHFVAPTEVTQEVPIPSLSPWQDLRGLFNLLPWAPHPELTVAPAPYRVAGRHHFHKPCPFQAGLVPTPQWMV